MKTLLIILGVILTFLSATCIAQDSSQKARLSQLLSKYYNVKDALVAGNAITASQNAKEFVSTVNGIDYKIISEGNVNALLKDAGAISESKDLEQQRKYFSNFSNNMFLLAKSVRLSTDTIYQQYCPMKKTYWLSSVKEIRNPYYGNVMLTCGNVSETLHFEQ